MTIPKSTDREDLEAIRLGLRPVNLELRYVPGVEIGRARRLAGGSAGAAATALAAAYGVADNVLDAVSTARFDPQPVFDRIVEHAMRLCDSSQSLVVLRQGGKLRYATAPLSSLPAWEPDDTWLTVLSGKAITVDDWDNRPADQFPIPIPRATASRWRLSRCCVTAWRWAASL